MQRLVTIIRQDLEPGYQIAQSIHSAVEFVMNSKEEVDAWHLESNYVLVLGCQDERHLEDIGTLLYDSDTKFRQFYEPDIDQYTSITFLSNDLTDEITKDMPLAGEVSGKINKDYQGNL